MWPRSMGMVQFGMLSALAALAIPIIVHLMFGRRARRIDLGTLRFLKIVLSENVRRKRLKRWLLLALRLVAVALLAFLFARPYLITLGAGGEDRLVILLIDRSASMGLRGGEQQPLDAAVRQAKTVLARCGERDPSRSGLVRSCHASVDRARQRGDLREPALRARRPAHGVGLRRARSSGPPTLGAAMAWAGDVAKQSRRSRKELYLYTDCSDPGSTGLLLRPCPTTSKSTSWIWGGRTPKTWPSRRLRVPKTILRPGESMAISVTLRNAGPFVREAVPVTLRLQNGNKPQEFHSQVRIEAGETGHGPLRPARVAGRAVARDRFGPTDRFPAVRRPPLSGLSRRPAHSRAGDRWRCRSIGSDGRDVLPRSSHPACRAEADIPGQSVHCHASRAGRRSRIAGSAGQGARRVGQPARAR